MSREEDRVLLDPIVAPSGMFVYNVSPWHLFCGDSARERGDESQAAKPVTLFNPMQPEVANERLRLTTQEYAGLMKVSYQSAKPTRVIKQAEIDNYGDALVSQVAPAVALLSHDVLILPLRGARQPGILHKTVTGLPDEKTLVLKYTNWSNPTRNDEIYADLRDRLVHHSKDREALNVGILDTAKGGNGSSNLARMMVHLHDDAYQGMPWRVHFHLIHSRERYPEKARFLEALSTSSVRITKTMYPVDDLLVEDWSEGIGLEATMEGGRFRMKRLTVPGKVAVQDSQGVTIYESEDLSKQITQFLADSVNESIFTSDDMQYVRDVWQDDAD